MGLEQEVVRYNQFRRTVLGLDKDAKELEKINIQIYTKYLLKEGSIIEKRGLLSSLKSKLQLKNKQIVFE